MRIILYLTLTALSLMIVASGWAEIDPKTIVGLWLFDEGAGKEALDSSGNKHDAILKDGAPNWVSGKYGKAFEFTGVEYFEVQNSAVELSFGGTKPFSITAWVKSQGGGYVVTKFNRHIIGEYILSIGGGGTVTFHREVAPWGLSGTKPVTPGEFSHVAITYDGEKMRIYVDGELDVEQKRDAQNTDTVTPVLIGGRFKDGKPDPDSRFRGVLDEVAIFNVALSKEQIKEVTAGLAPTKAVSVHGKLTTTWGRIKGD